MSTNFLIYLLTHALIYRTQLGTILDRIDYNMETAVEHAKEGVVQLEKAEENQKNALPVSTHFFTYQLTPYFVTYLVTMYHSSGGTHHYHVGDINCQALAKQETLIILYLII